MNGAFIIEVLTNDLITLQASGDRVLLSPGSQVQAKHREMVRAHKAEVLRVLRQWPNATAPAARFGFGSWRINADEQMDRQRPRVLTRPPR